MNVKLFRMRSRNHWGYNKLTKIVKFETQLLNPQTEVGGRDEISSKLPGGGGILLISPI